MRKFAILTLILFIGNTLNLTPCEKDCITDCFTLHGVDKRCYDPCVAKCPTEIIVTPPINLKNSNDGCYDKCYGRCLCAGEKILDVIDHLCQIDCQNNCITPDCHKL